MQPFEEHIAETAEPFAGIAEEAEFAEFPETEEIVVEAPSTDDPVRVYLREMGMVRLLSRQGEIDLAKRIERGRFRTRKALSHAPQLWRDVLTWYESVRRGEARLDEYLEIGGQDDARREKARAEAAKRISKLVRAHNQYLDAERKIAGTPKRFVNVRADLCAKLPRLMVKCSQAFREIPFD